MKIDDYLNAQPSCGQMTSKRVAIELEASFLSQMLKSSGLFESHSQFSGGIGESQFTSFLRDEFARKMAESGGVGLASEIVKEVDPCHDR